VTLLTSRAGTWPQRTGGCHYGRWGVLSRLEVRKRTSGGGLDPQTGRIDAGLRQVVIGVSIVRPINSISNSSKRYAPGFQGASINLTSDGEIFARWDRRKDDADQHYRGIEGASSWPTATTSFPVSRG